MVAQQAISSALIPQVPRREELGRPAIRPDVQERLDLSRTTARRRWIIRTGVMLFLTGAILFMIVTVQRDRTAASDTLRVLVPLQRELSAQMARLGQLPADLPEQFQQGSSCAYAGTGERLLIRDGSYSGAVLVASTPRIRQVLRPDGYAVLIWDRGALEIRWLTLTQYVRQVRQQEADIRELEQRHRAQLNNPR